MKTRLGLQSLAGPSVAAHLCSKQALTHGLSQAGQNTASGLSVLRLSHG